MPYKINFGRLSLENVEAQKVCLATIHLQSYYRVLSRVCNVKRALHCTRVIGFYVPIMTERGCVLVYPSHLNERATLARVYLDYRSKKDQSDNVSIPQ